MSTRTPAPGSTPATPDSALHRYDHRQRLTAARLQRTNPHWLVLWGCHSQHYWAFPLFAAPPGTIISAPGEQRLLAGMRRAEAEMDIRPHTKASV